MALIKKKKLRAASKKKLGPLKGAKKTPFKKKGLVAKIKKDEILKGTLKMLPLKKEKGKKGPKNKKKIRAK